MPKESGPVTTPQSPAAIQPSVEYIPSPEEAILLQLSRDWMGALLPINEARLRSMMAPDFTLQIWDGSRARQGINSWLDMALTRLVVTSFAYAGLNAQVFGDVAIVYSRFSWSGRVDGKPFSDRGFLTDFWQRRDGTWRVVTRRSAPVQQIQQLIEAPLPPD